MSNPLHRYHLILHAIASSLNGLSLPELATATGLPRSTAHRMAASLREIEYVDLDAASGNYVLGKAIVRLMRQSLVQDKKLSSFRPALSFIVNNLSETAFFARFTGSEVDLVEAITPVGKDRLYIYPGVGSRPLDKCSSSKAILAYLDRESLNAVLRPGNAIHEGSSMDAVIRELEQVNKQGFAVCDGEIDEGVYSVACPVLLGKAGPLYSIGIVGPAGRMKERGMDEIVDVLHAGADMAMQALLEDD